MIQYIIVGILFVAAIFFMVYKFVRTTKKSNCGEGNCGCK
jgi:hypothetical protein